MKTGKLASAGLAAIALAVGGAVLVPGTASAASYNGVCGSGYGVVNQRNVSGGTVYLTYSSGTGKNCVVTVRNNPGGKLSMGAWLKRSSDSSWQQDVGNYGTYAGPVYRAANGECVDWGGGISGSDVTVWRTNCG
ncbi:spore-associated protein A [Actinosynnema sp. NPDC050436]|uniref:spore-associated protein A n=1 Tax=Actinosynnema sp. NPDC050436 TaxID=3155659 RepID=UPI0034115254